MHDVSTTPPRHSFLTPYFKGLLSNVMSKKALPLQYDFKFEIPSYMPRLQHREKIGVVMLLIVLLVILLLTILLQRRTLAPTNNVENDTTFIHTVEKFDTTEQAQTTHWQSEHKTQPPQPKLFQFNPNTIDSCGLTQLGLSKFVVTNILKYRRKGGTYYSAEQFGHTYGLDSATFNQLLPYIIIEEKKPLAETQHDTPAQATFHTEERCTIVEINTADTTLLQQLKGIGSYRANVIVRYRNELGGYVSTEQICETKKIPNDVFETIAPFLTVDATKVQKLKINKASVDRLRRHPYINYYQARAIINLRREKQHISNIFDLLPLEEFSNDDLQRLEPYFDFE
ncbi:MAG: helix-hairpin-helix domain-containing protein [Bacteroidales bacterium]|nr:helix-hairpin-helix domain-containing protein [Bacteroidales bacterium]